jgi:threonylcarbamoyladenosine tRNA methylthiotransferase MtaB
VIPQGRGPSRSLRVAEVLREIEQHLALGAAEVVLTGVDVTSWGADLPGQPTLGQLVARILRLVPELPRLRLSSIDAAEIDPDLMRCLATEPRLMPYLHLSLQAGDDMILKRMKRRHSRADAVRTVERIKSARLDATIGADLIAGFPTETEDMAFNTLKLLEDCDIIAAHIFPFSPRPSTPAARMPQLSRELIKARAARLRAAAARRRDGWLDGLVGSTHDALIEGEGKGHTDNFAPLALEGAPRGQSGKVQIIGRMDNHLRAAWA